jgi:hypothetical protein
MRSETPQSIRTKRPYAVRLSEPFTRRSMLCLRVSPMSREGVHRLAVERSVSTSEYLAQLVNEHLNGVYRTRGPHILGLNR